SPWWPNWRLISSKSFSTRPSLPKASWKRQKEVKPALAERAAGPRTCESSTDRYADPPAEDRSVRIATLKQPANHPTGRRALLPVLGPVLSIRRPICVERLPVNPVGDGLQAFGRNEKFDPIGLPTDLKCLIDRVYP